MADDAGTTDATAATDTDATTDATQGTTAGTQDDDTSTLAEIKALAAELGITPGQLKGRLEASRKWEQRAKSSTDAATKATGQAQTATQQLAQVAKVLGLAPDDAPTPEKLQAAIAERDELLSGMQLERAVEKAARAAKGDVDLVVPALMYSGRLDGLDPSADDFGSKLDAVVKDLIEKNPKYRDGAGFPDLRQGNHGTSVTSDADPNAWLRRMAGR